MRSRLRVWLAVAIVAQLIAAGVLAGLSAVGWLDSDGGTPTPDPDSAADFAVDLLVGWVENLRWGQRLVEQVAPGLVEALIYFAGLPDPAGGYDPDVLRPPGAGAVRRGLDGGRGGQTRVAPSGGTACGRDPERRGDRRSARGARCRDRPAGPLRAQLRDCPGPRHPRDAVWALQCERKITGADERPADAWDACGVAVEIFRFPPG